MDLAVILNKSKADLVKFAEENNLDITFEPTCKKSQLQVQIINKLGLAQGNNTNNTTFNTHSSLLDAFKEKVPALIPLLPVFVETEVENFFSHFELVASSFSWPEEGWSLLLQSALRGTARSVLLSLRPDQSRNYWLVKEAILAAYRRCPEYYRQRFREEQKKNETFIEFQTKKTQYFEQWLRASKVDDFDSLKQLILRENLTFFLSDTQKDYVRRKSSEEKVENLALGLDAMQLHDQSNVSEPWTAPRGMINTNSGRGKFEGYRSRQQAEQKNPQEDIKDKFAYMPKKRLFCTFCKASGHQERFCYKKK